MRRASFIITLAARVARRFHVGPGADGIAVFTP
jgi:hypothetical protein